MKLALSLLTCSLVFAINSHAAPWDASQPKVYEKEYNSLRTASKGQTKSYELTMDLDIDGYLVVEPRHSLLQKKNTIQMRLVELGTSGARKELGDKFEVTYVDGNAKVLKMGTFTRNDLRKLKPWQRNAQSISVLSVEVASAFFLAPVWLSTTAGGVFVDALGIYTIPGALFAGGTTTATVGGVLTNGSVQYAKDHLQDPAFQKFAEAVANTINPSWASGLATLERLMKEVLLEERDDTFTGESRGAVRTRGEAMTLVGARGFRPLGIELSSDNDAASDLAEKMIVVLHTLNEKK